MAKYICTYCGYDEGKGKVRLRGSKGMEIFLWTTILIPGPFYSLWRRVGLQRECVNCGRPTIVRLNTDAGWLAQKRFDMELGIIKPKEKSETPSPSPAPIEPEPTQPQRIRREIDPDAW